MTRNQWISLYKFPHESEYFVETSTNDRADDIHSGIECPKERYGPSRASKRNESKGIDRDGDALPRGMRESDRF